MFEFMRIFLFLMSYNLFILNFRGQILPANILSNTVDVDLIYDGTKYQVQVNIFTLF